MRSPNRLHRLLLVHPIDDAHVRSAFDESGHADGDLGLAILATQQQMRPVVGRRQRGRDQRAVVKWGFFIGDDPPGIAGASALGAPLLRAGGGSIEAVVAFEPLAVVLDLTAWRGRVLRLRPRGVGDNGASDDQAGAHSPMRADRVSACKLADRRSAIMAGAMSVCPSRPTTTRRSVVRAPNLRERSAGTCVALCKGRP